MAIDLRHAPTMELRSMAAPRLKVYSEDCPPSVPEDRRHQAGAGFNEDAISCRAEGVAVYQVSFEPTVYPTLLTIEFHGPIELAPLLSFHLTRR